MYTCTCVKWLYYWMHTLFCLVHYRTCPSIVCMVCCYGYMCYFICFTRNQKAYLHYYYNIKIEL